MAAQEQSRVERRMQRTLAHLGSPRASVVGVESVFTAQTIRVGLVTSQGQSFLGRYSCVCVCVCLCVGGWVGVDVRVSERERESVCVCVCVCVRSPVS
jgi:hypothetical protein